MVLIIDDDINVINNLTARLELEDIDSKSFLDYKERLSYVKNNSNFIEENFKIIICDYFLSTTDNINGVNVLQEISSIINLPETILYTGNKKNIGIIEKNFLTEKKIHLIEKGTEQILFDIIEDKYDLC